MKQLWCVLSVVTSSLLFTASASAKENSSEALLQEMNQASQSLNYELSFISVNKQGIESQRYRHIRLNDQTLAQLLQMDGPLREVVQRGDEISYFEPGLEPFTLNGDYIVDSLPSIVYSNFSQLAAYYDFIPVGRTRIANRLCDVLRIVARDGTRYSYIVWLDTETKLPLRVDLLDRDGETLEQFRVISFSVGESLVHLMSELEKANLPPVFSVPESETSSIAWQVSWIPEGFKEISSSRRPLPVVGTPIESRLYSDGLFSFSVNVNEITGSVNHSDQLIRTGRRTIDTQHRDKAEITVVGELPPQTAKRIADSVKFETAP
ncbi:sigma-E factor regulatory protein RseB [Citrobacter sp. JGM124]|uniref:sigma-E factor regulatory protein RseB n=1 Tax=Citrobacter sp. JGM124 TaxID=2799789 RepID=UPI001BAB99C9|nr:sigma-E factor regulatory protein RseB [Citrobacter sp. JGM124]MBS0849073.1 sigma-E factor regulatory protein RseB [Citrobacter sp. JGM124]